MWLIPCFGDAVSAPYFKEMLHRYLSYCIWDTFPDCSENVITNGIGGGSTCDLIVLSNGVSNL